MYNHLNCKIMSVKGEDIEVEIAGNTLAISKKYFPFEVSVKDTYQLFLFNPKYPNVNEKALAKSILEEILNGK